MARASGVDWGKLERQFRTDHPDIARALDVFDISFEEYMKALRAQHPVVTTTAVSTGGAVHADMGQRAGRD
jgi:hypothetical protein